MRLAIDALLAAVALVGHFSMAVWLFNRLHALALPRKAIKVLEKALLLAAALVAIAFIVRWVVTGQSFVAHADQVRLPDQWIWSAYSAACWVAAIAVIPYWLVPKFREQVPTALLSNDTTVVDVALRLGFRPIHGAETSVLARFPGNEILHVAIQRKTIRLGRLPRELDGLSIAHLSDLHMTGQLGREFYDVVVNETNALDADLVVITGDILEKMRCLTWIPQTLGGLSARYGKYFVLGNHEKRLPDVAVLRRALVDAGFIDLGSRCKRVAIRGVEVLLAGTELPWFGAAPNVECGVRNAECKVTGPSPSRLGVLSTEHSVLGSHLSSDIPAEPKPSDGSTVPIPHSAFRTPHFRVLLSHTPDQLPWAKSHGFDLMLAGHNHGGQIRLPYLGALITPSLYGFRYASGLYLEPPTLLHVSRGIAGIHPIRLNCPPELALLVLRT